MRLSRAGYHDSNWMDALAAGKKKDVPMTEAEMAKDVMAMSIEAATGTRKPVAPDESIRRASAELHQQAVAAETAQHCSTIKAKLSDRGIDPIGLGVVSQKDWEGCQDPHKIEEIAKKAALESQKKDSLTWQEKGMTVNRSRAETETALNGRIMSTQAAGDDVSSNGRIAANQNSILDPDRLAKLFTQPTEHDQMVEQSVKDRYAKQTRRATEHAEAVEALKDAPEAMHGSAVTASGATQDGISSGQRAPTNQVSIFDDLSGGVGAAFAKKICDSKAEAQAAAAARSKSIHREKEADKNWNTVENLKPSTTSDLQGKLLSIWMPNAGE